MTPSNTPGGSQPGVFNLLAIEAISAAFDGASLRPGSFEAKGELRLVQLSHAEQPHAFRLLLEGAANVAKVEPNPALARRGEENGPLQVRIGARRDGDASKPLALMRYAAAPDFAPIPLKVTPRWAFADGIDRLELRVAAHPKIKGGLSDVRVSVTMGAEVGACRSDPPGEWNKEKRTLTWKVGHVPAGAPPVPFKADFATGGLPKAGRAGVPLTVHFASDSCNLTGLAPRAEKGGPVGKILQRFVSGKYVVHPPPPAK